jgi:cytochrome c peroxidase
MNTRMSFGTVALLVSLGGCVLQAGGGDEADESTDFSELDAVVARHGDTRNHLPNNVPMFDKTGVFTTVSAHGSIDLTNEFFQDLGSNGRRCVSCHVPTVGWTITPRQLQGVFDATDGGKYEDGFGLGAAFRLVDGANAPTADVSTLAKRRKAYSMLLSKGLIRVGLPIPATAEFELIAVDDPYHFASAAQLSLFRRPLPTTNLKFDSTVMWDGREVVAGQTVAFDLANQANDATLTHAQGQPLSQAQRESIVNFELGLATAQISDRNAGNLHAGGALGGPEEILAQPFHIGINDLFGDPVSGAAFNPVVFTLFDKWAHADGHDHDGHGYGSRGDDRRAHGGRGDSTGDTSERNDHDHDYDDHDRDHDDHGHDRDDDIAAARRSIARGQALFNSHPIAIAGVSGINDEAAFGTPTVVNGTCSTCHDTPNGGNHSVVAPLNIGLVDASRRTADMPLYTLRNKTTGQIVKVTDPGRAMIDGKWSHIGRFKGPMLRNLAPRAPYFHNGFAADLDAVVDFYNDRFHIGFSRQDKADLANFLRAL